MMMTMTMPIIMMRRSKASQISEGFIKYYGLTYEFP